MTLHLDLSLQMQHDHASDLRRSMGKRSARAAAAEPSTPSVRFVRTNAPRIVTASPGRPVGCVG